MNAQSRINEIVLLGQTNSTIYLRRPIAVADGDDGLHPGFASASNHLLAVWFETLAVKMRVGINKHGRWPSVDGRWHRLGVGSVLTLTSVQQ
jgi:hypothetical protein